MPPRTPRRTAKAPRRPASVLQFLVVLTRVEPLVWRRIQVPPTYSFWDLHVAIQDAMGWHDSHLHEFVLTTSPPPTFDSPLLPPRPNMPKPGTRSIGIPDDEFEEEQITLPGWKVPLTEITEAPFPHLPLRYAYDFGDGWEHIVMFEDEWAAEARAKYPRCVDGANRCPPEDCGGPAGYAHLLEVLARPEHPEHRELEEWLGGVAWDPHAFDPKAVRFTDPQKRWTRAFGGR